MATIPGVILFGGTDLQGGSAGNSPLSEMTLAAYTAGLAGLEHYSRELLRVIPDGADGEPTAATLSWWPWYDQNLGTLYVAAAGATANTVQVTPDPGWTTDQWAGFTVSSSSTNLGLDNKQKTVASNTSDTLTLTGTWTLNPPAGSAVWFNEGKFADYAAITGYRTPGEIVSVPPTRGGGAIAQGAKGIGYDAGLVRELWENVWTASPYFVLAKFPSLLSADQYADGAGPGQPAGEAWFTKVAAAFAARYPSDTVEWRYLILNHVFEDIAAWIAEFPTTTKIAAYQANLEAEIAWLRGSTMTNNSSLRVFLVNHDLEIRRADSEASSGVNAMGYANSIHREVVLDDAGGLVRALDFEGADLPTRGTGPAVINPAADQEYYDQHVYWHEAPKIIARGVELWEAGAAPAADGVMPVYVLIGDSIDVGAITSTYSTALDSDVLTNTARDSRQRIWNRTNQAIEAYDAHTNSQTSGSLLLSGYAGPEFSLTHELMLRHPDTGFVLVKRASASSAFATEATAYDANENGGTWIKATADEHYDELADDIANCLQAINVTLGKQAEVRAFFVNLGTNDASIAGSGATFAAALAGFVADLRDDFGTVVAGKATPVIWRLPQLGTAGRIYQELYEIRSALRDYAAIDSQFIAQNVDDLDRQSDNLHETAASNIIRGQRLDDELALIALPNCL